MPRFATPAGRIAAAAAALALLAPATARANGRCSTSISINFRPGNDQDLYLGTTFGLLISHDDGNSFHFVCEQAIGYGNEWDPVYAVAKNGDIYATTGGNATVAPGMAISQDGGCTWNPVGSPIDGNLVSTVQIGSDGRVWVVTGNGDMPNDVYVSADGKTFTSSGMQTPDAFYRSIAIAPSDPERLYLTGERLMGANGQPQALLYRSDDGGTTWQPLDVSGFSFGDMPTLTILAVSPADPDLVFARVALAPASGTGTSPDGSSRQVDAVYRSTDAGATWTDVLEMSSAIKAFVVESDGNTVIAGSAAPRIGARCPTTRRGVQISTDGGKTWSDHVGQLQMQCIGQRGDGALFACGGDHPPDSRALTRSTDGQTWNKVMTFDEIAGPLQCGANTVQQSYCALRFWPIQCGQIGACPVVDGPPMDAGTGGHSGHHGCGGCSIGLAAVLIVLPWRRRRGRRGRRGRPGA